MKQDLHVSMCVYVLVAWSCLTLFNPMDCGLPGFSVHRILQTRILEWVAIPFIYIYIYIYIYKVELGKVKNLSAYNSDNRAGFKHPAV